MLIRRGPGAPWRDVEAVTERIERARGTDVLITPRYDDARSTIVFALRDATKARDVPIRDAGAQHDE
jgi:hypothetical protein